VKRLSRAKACSTLNQKSERNVELARAAGSDAADVRVSFVLRPTPFFVERLGPRRFGGLGDAALESLLFPLSEAESGAYSLRVGVYHRESGERLKIRESSFPVIEDQTGRGRSARHQRLAECRRFQCR
jgi:hypothetical protein